MNGATPCDINDDAADVPVDIAGFEGNMTAEVWRLDEAGNRVTSLVLVKLRCGVYADGDGSGFLEYLHPSTGDGVSDFLPAPIAQRITSALTDQERMNYGT